MIVKIWPIKGDVGAKNCLLYIEDDKKVTKIEKDEDGRITKRTVVDTQQEYGENADQFFIENEENIERVFDYMANEDKTKNVYVSGFGCNPKNVINNFRNVWTAYQNNGDQTKFSDEIPNENETMAFHLVQSFPEDLIISDEEVHQCGLELLAKLKDYQGVVCSHVHPVVDEEGEVHGRCKHNHILINAYKNISALDKDEPEKRKYHNCKETYELLQFWNDEIAIDHGLPIILNPDLNKVYSWTESDKNRQDQSWKERVRLDIEAARRDTSNWNEFVSDMQERGYEIRDGGKHITYTAPNGKKIRAERLGRTYTKENLDLYWVVRARADRNVYLTQKANEAPPLSRIRAEQDGKLTVDIPLGRPNKEGLRRYYTMPLEKSERKPEVLNTYFYEKELYDVKNAEGKVVLTTTGREIVDYLIELQRGDEARVKQEEKEDRARRLAAEDKEKKEEAYQTRQRNKQQYYTSHFKNSRTGRPYVAERYDENGHRRSSIEVIFILAIAIIKNEADLWEPKNIPPGRENEAVFGPPDWKSENMLASLHYATEAGLGTPSEVDIRVNEVGAAYSRANADVKRSKQALENMKPIADAIAAWRETKDLIEKLEALPEGTEKERLKEQYADELAKYKKARATMYAKKINTNNEVTEFLIRYEDIRKKMPDKEQRLEEVKDDYRQLKKLQYNLRLAQNSQYCYGPAYTPEKAANRGNLGQQVDEKEFDNNR